MNQHIRDLASKLGIRLLNKTEARVVWNSCGILHSSKPMPSFAHTWQEERVVFIDPEDGPKEVHYWAGLHEFGHQAYNHDRGFFTPWDEVFEQEVEAWEWAVANSKRKLTDRVILFILDALSTYADLIIQ